MSPNRKAALQRKLAMAPIPKPPAGLAERIKHQIPKSLPISIDTERERKQLWRSVTFDVRVAASILLLISSAYLCVHLLWRADRERKEEAIALERATKMLEEKSAAASATASTTATNVPSSTAYAFATPPSAKVADAATRPRATDDVPPAAKPAPPYAFKSEAKDERSAREGDVVGGVAGGVVGGAVGNVDGGMTGQAPAVAPAAPPPPPRTQAEDAIAQAAPPATAAAAPVMTEPRPALHDFVKTADAAELSMGAPTSFFGYDIDPKHAGSLQNDVRGGKRPNARQLSAVMQHFTEPVSRPRREVRLEAEAAPAPLDDTKRLLRISIDTPKPTSTSSTSVAPVGADASFDVAFDPRNVIAHRALGGEPSPHETALLENVSLTTLFDVELRPKLSHRAVIATVTLRYRPVNGGKERTLTRVVRAGDVARSWTEATSRMQAASLVAAWIGGAPAEDVIAKATAAKLTELADLVAAGE